MVNLVNDSFNLLPGQSSSNNTSRYFYTSGQRATQSGVTFHDGNANFTDDMVGGLVQFAGNEVNKSYSYSSMIIRVENSHTLTLSTSQNISDTDYIIWYGGVQFDQTGVLSAQSFIVGTAPFNPANFEVDAVGLTGTGVYTPGIHAKYLTIEAVAAGGAGGSTIDQAVSVGGAGGAGAYLKVTVPAMPFNYQCGTGGVFVAGNTGGTGGNTIITGLPFGTLTLNGGLGGAVTSNSIGAVAAAGGAGGNDLNVAGVLSFAGESGGYGYADTSLTTIFLQSGGSTPFGTGARGIVSASVNGSVAGINANKYGTGGSGSGKIGSGAVVNGGNGGAGFVYVTSYSL